MKRRLSLLLAVVMILGSFSFAFAAEKTAEEEAGAFLMKVGVLEGINGELKLEDNLRRQDAVVLIARLHGAEEEAEKFPTDDLTFTDFKDPYYRPIIAWAVANNLVEGHTPERFGFNEDVTAQQYATILLRALGYNEEVAGKDGYDKALELAKKLGLLENVEVEKDTAITRGQMAVLTFNALGTNMKDSDKTLADKLGIEMPEPDELKVEKVYTENLKEIVVELSNAKLADKDKLQDANNYKLTGNVVKKAELKDNDVILLLKDPLIKGREYELIVRGMDKDLNGKYEFEAKDNTIPAVEKVEVLGEYGIKVTTTEPVDDPKERNFLIDGKNVAMEVEQYGRNIILTPYYNSSFSENAKTLTVKELKDYAGYKSVAEDFEIEIKKDEVAPKVVDVISRGNEVEVIFDKDIYEGSVTGYYSRSSVGNVYYEAGRHTVYAEKGEKIDTNKALYTFKDELPRRTVLTIEGVTNHSKVKMEKTTMEARELLDYTEPEVIDKKVYTSIKDKENGIGKATIYLYFDKDVKGSFVKDSDKEFEVKDHFTLYEREVYKRNVAEDKVKSAKYDGDRKDVIVVELDNLTVWTKDNDLDYILEVIDFTDATSQRNKMYRYYVDFKVTPKAVFTVKDIDVHEGRYETEIVIEFNRAVNRTLAENLSNYLFKVKGSNAKYDVAQLGGEAIVEGNGYNVRLVLPDFDKNDFDTLEILPSLKDKDGNRLNQTVYTFATDSWKEITVDPDKKETAITYIYKGNDVEGTLVVDDGTDMEDISVKVTGKDGDKASVLVYDKDGAVVTSLVQNITIPASGTETKPLASTSMALSAGDKYTVVTKIGEEEAKLVVKVVNTSKKVDVVYNADSTIKLTDLAADGTMVLPYGTKVNDLPESAFTVIGKENATATFSKKLNKLFITVTAENGEQDIYTVTLTEATIDASSSVTASKAAPTVDEEVTITVVLKDTANKAVTGIADKFVVTHNSTEDPQTVVVGEVTETAVPGTYTFTVKDSKNSHTVTYTITVDGVELSTKPEITTN